MKRKLKAVLEFHEAFGLGVKQYPVAKLAEQKLKLRFDLMAEENEEYLHAAANNDLVEVADALLHLVKIYCRRADKIIQHAVNILLAYDIV